ncbi:MAG: LacI family DNA-binding transcriptional regulator [Chloroflexota bacterium]
MAQRTTSRDVAQIAGVSRTTVSLVLNNVKGIRISEAARQRVLDAARELNYHPDIAGRNLASGKSWTIGLVLRQSPEQVFADALLPQVLMGLEQAVLAQGFQVLLKSLEPGDTSGYLRLINENHVDGIILSGPRQDDSEILHLKQDGFPVMLMGQLPGSGIPCVDINAENGAEIAVQHLLEQGHRRIAMITNASLEYTSAQQRHSGFLNALEKAGISPNESHLVAGDYTPASGYKAMNKLFQATPSPTAVFVASDVVALGAILAIKHKGLRIPQDVAVVGFDDIPLAEYFDPPLTTVRIPAFGLGWAVGERLLRLIRFEGLDKDSELLESELIVRQSSIVNSGLK